MACDNQNDVDNFKPLFKYYKQKASKPSFDDVIDFYKTSKYDVTVKTFKPPQNTENLGLKQDFTWNIYHLDRIPGLFFICNPFTDEGKKLWIQRCLREYPCKPNVTNIDGTNNESSPWEKSVKMMQLATNDSLACNAGQLKLLKSCPVWKLRWATLGLHHDWNTKEYSISHQSEFPDELSKLSSVICSAIGWPNYTAEAAIVNYYHVGSTLSPHTDHSEQDLTCPLVSVSFGLPAIFLIGGQTKSVKPEALLVRSGDVIIMSGRSRLAYHAVPKIIDGETDFARHDPIEIFTAHSRINMNVRQFQS